MAHATSLFTSFSDDVLRKIGYPRLSLDEKGVESLLTLFLVLIHLDHGVTKEENAECVRFLKESVAYTQVDYHAITAIVLKRLESNEHDELAMVALVDKACARFTTPEDKQGVLTQLSFIAHADGELELKETLFLDRVAEKFGIDSETFQQIVARAAAVHPQHPRAIKLD